MRMDCFQVCIELFGFVSFIYFCTLNFFFYFFLWFELVIVFFDKRFKFLPQSASVFIWTLMRSIRRI